MEKLGNGKYFSDRDDSGSGSLCDGAVFDASQYSFFGKNVMDAVELGGLEDEEEEGVPVLGGGLGDEEELQEFHLFGKNELNKVVSGPRHPGIIGDRGSGSGFGSFPRESSSATDWAREADFPDWLDHRMSDSECYDENKRWSHSHIALRCIIQNLNHCIEHRRTHSSSSSSYNGSQVSLL